MGSIEANIRYFGELDLQAMEIPFYQRPYRWQTSHVEVLLQTLYDNLDKEEYRIGSIILHAPENEERIEIVDGQQRLTTLSLLMMCLEGAETNHKLTCKFCDVESHKNVAVNYSFINRWAEIHGDKRKELSEFVKERCSVVVIMAKDLSDAFQMFDSQNGRGKELEAYNLLKAYHLRAMDNDRKNEERRYRNTIVVNDEKKEIDKAWEKSVMLKTADSKECLLKHILNSLYRIRKWSHQREAWIFDKSEVKEFKGLQFYGESSALPLSNMSFLLYLYYKTENQNTDNSAKARSLKKRDGQNPYVGITMEIINGKLFFEYVQTYVDSYDYLLKEEKTQQDPLYEFQKDFRRWCCDYQGASRTGDGYIREVYVALVMALYDRFGEEYVVRYYKILYNLSYRERLKSKRITERTASKFAHKYFECIASAIHEIDLSLLCEYASEPIEKNMEKTGGIEAYIEENQGLLKKKQ